MAEVAQNNSPAVNAPVAAATPSANTDTGTGQAGREIAAKALQEASIHLDYASASNDLYYAMKGGFLGMGTDETTVMTTLQGLSKLPADKKQEFLNFYAKSHGGESLESHLAGELNGKEYTEAMLLFYGESPELAPNRAALIAGRIDDASAAEIKQLLAGRSPEEKGLINEYYAAAHNGNSLVSKFQKMPISSELKRELVIAADGTPEGAIAASLYYYARSQPDTALNILAGMQNPEEIAKVEQKFKDLFKVNMDLETYLRRNAPTDAYASKYDDALDKMQAIAASKAAPAPEKQAEKPAESKPAEANPTEAKPVEVKPEASPQLDIVKMQQEMEKQIKEGASPFTPAQSSYELALNRRALDTAQPGTLMDRINQLNIARIGNDLSGIEKIKADLTALAFSPEGRAQLESWYERARDWHPEKPLSGNYTPEQAKAISAHRCEFHLAILDLLKNPSQFDVSSALLSEDGVSLEAYHKRRSELLDELTVEDRSNIA